MELSGIGIGIDKMELTPCLVELDFITRSGLSPVWGGVHLVRDAPETRGRDSQRIPKWLYQLY